MLLAIFGLVLNCVREDDEAARPLTTLLSVVVSTLSVLIILLAPSAVPLPILLRAVYLCPNAASYGNLWHLFALALMIALLAWSHRWV